MEQEQTLVDVLFSAAVPEEDVPTVVDAVVDVDTDEQAAAAAPPPPPPAAVRTRHRRS